MTKRFGDKQMTETFGAKGRKVMVSYEEPVVVVDGNNYFVTEEKFSKTTTRHINVYLIQENAVNIHRVDPQIFRKLVTGEI